MQEKLKDLKNNTLLGISNWWGLHNPGTSGILVTTDKVLYKYTLYYRETKFLRENKIPLEYISEGIKLTEQEYQMIIEFIENEIIGKTFESASIFDASWTVFGKYKEYHFNIVNNIDFSKKTGLYDRTKELLDKLKGGK